MAMISPRVELLMAERWRESIPDAYRPLPEARYKSSHNASHGAIIIDETVWLSWRRGTPQTARELLEAA